MIKQFAFLTIIALSFMCSASEAQQDKASGLAARRFAKNASTKSSNSGNYEAQDTVPASSVVAVMTRKGLYKVEPSAVRDGFMYFFTVTTPYGKMTAYGLTELNTRLAEMPAVAELAKISSTSQFGKSVGDSVTGTAKSVANVVTHPVETAEGIPGAMGRLYESASKTVSRASNSIKDSSDDKNEKSSSKSSSGSTVNGVANAGADLIGYSDAKRNLAKQVRVDPYSENPLLQKELVRLARVSTGGALSTMLLPIPSVVGILQASNDLIWSKSEKELDELNTADLQALGVEPRTARDFVRNDAMSTSNQTRFVLALKSMRGVANLSAFVAMASQVDTPTHAAVMVSDAILLSQYHKNVAPLKSFDDTLAPIAAARTSSGTLVLPTPFDYLMWTSQAATFVTRESAQLAKAGTPGAVELYISGAASPRASKEFAQAGWKLRKAAAIKEF